MWPDQVTSLLERTAFPPAGSDLACAVSGGADSVALMALASAAGCRVSAIHVDHGLRPSDAAEASLVARNAGRLGARFSSVAATVRPGPNLEARARAARFACLPAEVATGHTMDDQVETVLCNLLRGAALDGLAGMRQGWRHPLLGLRRAETRAVCRALGLAWFEDPSNDDPRFLRNRIRHELIPLCCGLSGRDVVPVIARQAVLMASDGAELDAWAAELVPDPTDARRVAAVPSAAARRAVRRWLRSTGPSNGGRGRLPGRHPPSLAEVERVMDVARGAARATELDGGRRVVRSAGRLYQVPEASEATSGSRPLL